MNKILLAIAVLALGLVTLLLVRCSSSYPVQPPEIDFLPAFDKAVSDVERPNLRGDSLDLYIDYSTCVADAPKSSAFFKAIRPVLTDTKITFWSIKGADIKAETNDKQRVYDLLENVNEVIHADIKGAVRRIVDGDREAMLITDAEYFRKGFAGDNLTNPYLADELKTWMKRGHDLYIYCEPYREKVIGSDREVDKFRYYMIFTDDRIAGSFHDRFEAGCPAASQVQVFHLSSKAPRPAFDNKDCLPAVNDMATPVVNFAPRDSGLTCIELQTPWDDIFKYLVTDATDDDGKHVDKGLPLVRGIFVNTNFVRITEVDVRVSLISNQLQAFADSLGHIAPARDFSEVDDLFLVDEDLLKDKGEIALFVNPEFTGQDLLDDRPNLLKVELVVDDYEDDFIDNDEVSRYFKWPSITDPDKTNTSLLESLRFALMDAGLKKAGQRDKVIYTFYLNTCPR